MSHKSRNQNIMFSETQWEVGNHFKVPPLPHLRKTPKHIHQLSHLVPQHTLTKERSKTRCQSQRPKGCHCPFFPHYPHRKRRNKDPIATSHQRLAIIMRILRRSSIDLKKKKNTSWPLLKLLCLKLKLRKML